MIKNKKNKIKGKKVMVINYHGMKVKKKVQYKQMI